MSQTLFSTQHLLLARTRTRVSFKNSIDALVAIRKCPDRCLGRSSCLSLFHPIACNKRAVSPYYVVGTCYPQPGSHPRGEDLFLLHTMSSTQDPRGCEFAVWLTRKRTCSQKEQTRKRFEETAKRARNIRWLVTIDEKAKVLASAQGTDVSGLLAQLVREECARKEE